MLARSAGSLWRAATDGVLADIPAEIQQRYAEALDLLAEKVGPDLLDCHGGTWEARGDDELRHKISLVFLAKNVISKCELARSAPADEHPRSNESTGHLTSVDRQRIARNIDAVVADLKRGGFPIRQAILRSALRFVTPHPDTSEPEGPPRDGLTNAQWRLFHQVRRPTTSFIAALEALARDLASQDDRPAALRRRQANEETQLAAQLVELLREATKDDQPFYRVVATFVSAAGWRIAPKTIKKRLEASTQRNS